MEVLDLENLELYCTYIHTYIHTLYVLRFYNVLLWIWCRYFVCKTSLEAGQKKKDRYEGNEGDSEDDFEEFDGLSQDGMDFAGYISQHAFIKKTSGFGGGGYKKSPMSV